MAHTSPGSVGEFRGARGWLRGRFWEPGAKFRLKQVQRSGPNSGGQIGIRSGCVFLHSRVPLYLFRVWSAESHDSIRFFFAPVFRKEAYPHANSGTKIGEPSPAHSQSIYMDLARTHGLRDLPRFECHARPGAEPDFPRTSPG